MPSALDKDHDQHIAEPIVTAYLTGLPTVSKAYPFDKSLAVYEVNGKMFALLNEGSDPLRVSLRCDSMLAQTLRERYETVMQPERLDKDRWNTIVLTGQLNWEEIQHLIHHAYQLALQADD